MNGMQSDKLPMLADKNLAASILHRNINSKNGKLIETDSYIIYTIGIDNEDGHINGLLCLNGDCYEEALEKAEDFFKSMDRNYVVWVRDHADNELEEILKAKGLKPKREPGAAGMAIRHRVEPVNVLEGFEIRRITTSKEVQDFALVTRDAFDKPYAVIKEMFSSHNILVSPKSQAFVVYQNKRPVAAASMILSDNIAGIYWVGVAEDARGKGLGSYVTQAITNAGFDSGAEAVILQASIAGERVYKKLGYETITYYRSYVIEGSQ